jgi:hypothetical protein
VSVYERDKKSQRRYTAWGFFLGLLGILFAAYAYVNPLTGARAEEKTTHQIEGAPNPAAATDQKAPPSGR